MVNDKPNFNYNYSHIPDLKAEENNCYLLEIDYDLLPKNNWSLSVDLEYPVFLLIFYLIVSSNLYYRLPFLDSFPGDYPLKKGSHY